MNRNGTKWLVAALALALVIGVAATGAIAAVNSGATDFSILAFPTTTSVGQDAVNVTIQVLDKDGNVNTFSSGQYGDVLFQITSSIGTATIPAAGGVGASVAGGQYQAANLPNVRPNAGVLMASVQYAGSSGTDTITVAMYEAIINAAGNVVSGAIIGTPKSVNITVNQGSTITAITGITFTNSLFPAAAQEDTVAGRATGIQVNTRAGESGTVTVSFVGINRADAFGNNANGTTVTADVVVNNGVGIGNVTLTKAGFYEVRGAAAGGVTFTRLQAIAGANDIIGAAFALYVRPGAATNLTLTTEKDVVAAAGAATTIINQATITRRDANGNATGWANPATVAAADAPAVLITLTGSNANLTMPAAANIPAGAHNVVQNLTGAAAGNCTVTAKAPAGSGIADSAGKSIIVAATGFTAAQIDDGSGAAEAAGIVTRSVGSTLRVMGITGAGLAAGQPVSLKFGTQTLTSSLTAAGAGIYAATFTLPNTAMGGAGGFRAVLQAGNGAVGSYVLSNVAAAEDNTLRVVAAAGATVQIQNPNGFKIDAFNANNRGLAFNFPNQGQGAHFQVIDQFGNDVTFATSGLTGTLTSTDLAGGNNTVVNLGSDAAVDQLLTWAASVKGTKAVTLTPIVTSGIPALTFNVTNLGTPTIASIKVTPGTNSTLANSTIPVIVETFDSNGRRSSVNLQNNLIVTIEGTKLVARLTTPNAGAVANGAVIDTNFAAGSWNGAAGAISGSQNLDGRTCLALLTGNVNDTIKVKVQTLDGQISADSGEIKVSVNAPPQVGKNPGLTETTLGATERFEMMINSTNTHGDTPTKTYFVITAKVKGAQLPTFLLTSAGKMVEVSKANLDTDTYTFTAGGTTSLGIMTLNDILAFSSGDVFAYAYAYQNATGDIVMDNIVVITVK